MTAPTSLADWLQFQQTQHVKPIDLGLSRVHEVWQRLGALRPAPAVITVGGTNGKGSTVAFLDAMLSAAGYRVGVYTSPHLLHYNERVKVAGVDASDDELIAIFERIERARGTTTLTYFEYGTLAALAIFAERAVEIAILEVGLGGRLDAVNIVDSDAAIVTTVDFDHTDLLGNDLDAIGFEKAGILRSGRPAILGDVAMPQSVIDHAQAIGADILQAGHDYHAVVGQRDWRWSHRDGTALILPLPALQAPVQIANAAAAIAALHALRSRLPIGIEAIARGVASAQIAGRLQRIAEHPEIVLDIGHNAQAARALGHWITANPIAGRLLAVFSGLGDKDLAALIAPLVPQVERWYLAGLHEQTPRGLIVEQLVRRVIPPLMLEQTESHDTVAHALQAARAAAGADDRILVFGSFYTVVAALREPR